MRVNYGAEAEFALGVEEELLLVDAGTLALEHSAVEVLGRVSVPKEEGALCPEAYAALVELTSPVCTDAAEAVSALARLRERLHAAGATTIGAGLHPDGAFGDVVHHPGERYALIAQETRGLLSRTPTCAVHVHVGLPDAETAIRTYNGLRAHLPLLQALSANSPFWHGRDSGLQSARALVFRAFSSSEIPVAFESFDQYAEQVEATVAAGGLPDYTYLWWDVRPHPALGTVEVRAMDGQSSLRTVAGLAALVHALALHAAEHHGPYERRETLMESSFRAARDGLGATLWHDGALRPVTEIAQATLDLARPHARELNCDGALDEIDRILAEGNGASRQRAAFDRGGMTGLLTALAATTADLRLGAAGARP